MQMRLLLNAPHLNFSVIYSENIWIKWTKCSWFVVKTAHSHTIARTHTHVYPQFEDCLFKNKIFTMHISMVCIQYNFRCTYICMYCVFYGNCIQLWTYNIIFTCMYVYFLTRIKYVCLYNSYLYCLKNYVFGIIWLNG